MEVVAATPTATNGVSPFRDHDVREWSRIDSLTGALERARLETDSWTTNTTSSRQKYGKVVDSRARTDADGAVHQQARRQLEVFHSQIPGGRLQVIKTHTVSSSRWTSSTAKASTATTSTDGNNVLDAFGNKEFEDLKLSLNSLDVTSQKSKATVGRSFIRRPPTRHPRPRDTTIPPDLLDIHVAAATNLHRVSRLCHQIHDTAVRHTFGRKQSQTTEKRPNGDGSENGVRIVEIEQNSSNCTTSDKSSDIAISTNGHLTLTRTKSSSSDDIHLLTDREYATGSNINPSNELDDSEQLQDWRRTSKLRRSLQFPKHNKPPYATKQIDIPESTVSVRKITEELEKGRRLSTALRNNSVDLEALDQILQSISSSSSSTTGDVDNELAGAKIKQKRDSFVTVESIKEVKEKLRKTAQKKEEEETDDDGIVTDETSNRVRSYVYGMEAMLNKKPMIGTGSLESRSKMINSNNTLKNEDWYNRRKSYGFEQVHNQDNNAISFKHKNVVESSTDSGICRSSEINNDNSNSDVTAGKVKKITNIFNQDENNSRRTSLKDINWYNNELKSTTITIPIVKNNNVVDLSWNGDTESKRHSIAVDESKYVKPRTDDFNQFRRTSLTNSNDPLQRLDDDDVNSNNRSRKKVEFCKTEVHFTAESGKVNIVETDEKPPPTQNFRRRRRNSGPIIGESDDSNRSSLPVLHFGDSDFEKTMFGITDDAKTLGIVTVSTKHDKIDFPEDDEFKKELNDSDNIRGILKNKPIKPKPYHLGEGIPDSNSDDDSNKWGVKLRPTWKSTVTVHNSFYNNNNNSQETNSDQPEFQKLLRSLRPTKKSDDDSETNNFSNIRIVSPLKDDRRASWSVADKIRLNDDVQNAETIRGYLTKVNFGNGEAIVLDNEKDAGHSKWQRTDHNLNTEDSERLRPPVNKIDHTKTTPQSSRNKLSPITFRKPSMQGSMTEVKSMTTINNLSSPSLVGRNSNFESPNKLTRVTRESSSKELFKNVIDDKLQSKHTHDNIVLRQPKQSEMTYFGVNLSPQSNKKTILSHEKPDLLKHHHRTPSPNRKSKPKIALREKPSSPIYENVKLCKRYAKEFDSSILDELTKAADQILQAVNGYADDKITSDEDKVVKETLETISETKSLQNSKSKSTNKIKSVNSSSNTKQKVNRTSSTSSVESISKDRRRVERKPVEAISSQVTRKKVSSDSSSLKARRIQRACSREALLQSHGSSSEDLAANTLTPIRKPRLIKKTKSSQFTITNGIELKKPSTKKKDDLVATSKGEERILNSLSEIRHKTAVSTIRSTNNEKCSRDRSRQRSEELKNKPQARRDSKVQTSSVSRQSAAKAQSSNTTRTSNSNNNSNNVTTHRISTANIKKCQRAESIPWH